METACLHFESYNMNLPNAHYLVQSSFNKPVTQSGLGDASSWVKMNSSELETRVEQGQGLKVCAERKARLGQDAVTTRIRYKKQI